MDLTIRRQPTGNRLPSLMNRNRALSSLAGSGSGLDMSSHPIMASKRMRSSLATLSMGPETKKIKADPQSSIESPTKVSGFGKTEGGVVAAAAEDSVATEGGVATVVEESGPVHYYDGEEAEAGEEDEEEVEDVPLDDLEYPDDPLNHSDYEDYEN